MQWKDGRWAKPLCTPHISSTYPARVSVVFGGTSEADPFLASRPDSTPTIVDPDYASSTSTCARLGPVTHGRASFLA